MALIVDTASATRRLAPEEFARWAAPRTVFLSSEMRALTSVRAVVADALRAAGFSVVMHHALERTLTNARGVPRGSTPGQADLFLVAA